MNGIAWLGIRNATRLPLSLVVNSYIFDAETLIWQLSIIFLSFIYVSIIYFKMLPGTTLVQLNLWRQKEQGFTWGIVSKNIWGHFSAFAINLITYLVYICNYEIEAAAYFISAVGCCLNGWELATAKVVVAVSIELDLCPYTHIMRFLFLWPTWLSSCFHNLSEVIF